MHMFIKFLQFLLVAVVLLLGSGCITYVQHDTYVGGNRGYYKPVRYSYVPPPQVYYPARSGSQPYYKNQRTHDPHCHDQPSPRREVTTVGVKVNVVQKTAPAPTPRTSPVGRAKHRGLPL